MAGVVNLLTLSLRPAHMVTSYFIQCLQGHNIFFHLALALINLVIPVQ